MADKKTPTGFEYRPGVRGKFHFRVRERHVADTYIPLIRAKKIGAVKVDLMLRGIGLLPDHAGPREPGLVLPSVSYEDIHDLCRVSSRFRTATPEDEIDDPKILAVKRNWVGKQLSVLEDAGAVRRGDQHRGRPSIVVQRDIGGGPLDDPDGSPGNSYVTMSGPVLARWLPVWGTPELVAYLAAMIADRYARLRPDNAAASPGGATWFQSLDWFADEPGRRPEGHVRTPFSVRTLERGLAGLSADGLVTWKHSSRRPDQPGRRFRSGRRNIYTNHFDAIDRQAETSTGRAEKELNPGGARKDTRPGFAPTTLPSA